MERDDILECDLEWHELLDDIVVYEERLLRLSENLCFGDFGLIDPSAVVASKLEDGLGAGEGCAFLTFKVNGRE